MDAVNRSRWGNVVVTTDFRWALSVAAAAKACHWSVVSRA